MVFLRPGIELIRKLEIERFLLRGGRLQQQQHSVKARFTGNLAEID